MPHLSDLINAAAAQCNCQDCQAAIGSLEGAAQLAAANWRIHLQIGLCLSGGCRSHALVSAAAALYHFEAALSSLPKWAPREERASVLAALGNTLPAAEYLPLKTRAMAAVARLEEAAAIYDSLGRGEGWARQQYNLGNVWCELPIESFPDKWEQAIRHYKAALRIWTLDDNPAGHARILQNLGTAYRELGTGNPARNRWDALTCSHRALQLCRAKHPGCNMASVHNNIGNIFLAAESHPGNRIRHVHMALGHFDWALRLLNRESGTHVYAITAFNRGQALLQLAVYESGAQRLCEARAAFLESQRVFVAEGEDVLAKRAGQQLQAVCGLISGMGTHPEMGSGEAAAAICSGAAQMEDDGHPARVTARTCTAGGGVIP